MPRTIRPTWSPKGRRRTFSAQVFGLSQDKSVDALKRYLHQASLTTDSEEKLDLVMLEDYDHLLELVAREGFPLIREGAYPPAGRYLRVRWPWLWPFILTLALLILFAGEGPLWDIFPWR